MKLNTKIPGLAVGIVLLCAAGSCNALGLGKARGAVLLGQPLSLNIGVQHGADEDTSDWCFDAEVYYGDVRQEAGRVTAIPLRSESSVITGVRVIAAAPVDEPVVTVYLRSTCGLKTSRKYVLLSDLVSDLLPTMPVESSSVLAKTALATSGATTTDLGIARQRPERTLGTQSSVVKKPQKPEFGVRSRAVPPVQSPLRPGPRLSVSILDFSEVKDPNLRWSSELASVPTEDREKKEVARALWRSLNISSGDVIQDDAKHVAISADLNGLKELTSKNQQELKQLSSRLIQAESERFSNPLVFVLVGLLIAALVVVAKLVIALRSSPRGKTPWWSGGSPVTEDDEDDFDLEGSKAVPIGHSVVNESASTASSLHAERGIAENSPAGASSISLDIDLDLSNPLLERGLTSSALRDSAQAASAPTPSSSPYQRDFSHSLNATLHAINTQEMLDVRQQADFFMTLGQHEEAISLLETSIRESDASNPLVYIDLLNVLHTLSRKSVFDHYRNEFNSIFTGWAPQYSVFGQPGNSLDAYPQICAEIAHVWGTEAALGFLEQCMVRSPEDAPEHYFDLDAFRDLLLLHAIAGRVGMNSTTDSGIMPFSAMRSSANSVSAVVDTVESIGTNSPRADESLLPNGISTDIAVESDASKNDGNLIDFDASGISAQSPLQGSQQ